MKRKKKLNKRLLAAILVIVFLVGGGTGLWLFLQYRNDSKTVEVVPVLQVSDSYWGDQSSSSGMVVSDYVQELHPDSSKVISEIFVKEGDAVRIGDPLLQYDKDKLELEVEAKSVAVLKAALNLENAQKQLKKLQNTKATSTPSSTSRPVTRPTARPTPRPTAKPGVTPSPTPTPVPPADVTLYSRLDLDSQPYAGSGTTEDPYLFLCTSDCIMTPDFLRWLLGLGLEPTPTPVPTPTPEPESSEIEDDNEETEDGGDDGKQDEGEPTPTPEPTPEPTGPETSLITPFAAVFEVRDGNSNYGKLISAFKLDGNKLSANFEISNSISGVSTLDSIATLFGATPSPDNYNDMGYTANELKQLITEKKEEIQNLQVAKKQADLDLTIAELQLKNSTVLSTVDGTVRSLLDMESASAAGKPFLVVSGESTYYVEGAVSEAALINIKVGDQVTVVDYMTGNNYTAQIVSISDYPLDSDSNLYYYGSGNPNSSSYQFTAVVEQGDGLQSGQYVDINLSVQDEDAANALYIQNAYIREDDAGSYVMKAGHDDRLVKQYVRTGRSLYGYSTEIKSGLDENDYIAFPYGPDVKEGVRVVLQGTSEPPTEDEDDIPTISVGGEVDSAAVESSDGTSSWAENGETGSAASSDFPEDAAAASSDFPEDAAAVSSGENGTSFQTEDGGGVTLD